MDVLHDQAILVAYAVALSNAAKIGGKYFGGTGAQP